MENDNTLAPITPKDITAIQTAKADEVASMNEVVTDATQQVVRTQRELSLLNESLIGFKDELDKYNQLADTVRRNMQDISKKL